MRNFTKIAHSLAIFLTIWIFAIGETRVATGVDCETARARHVADSIEACDRHYDSLFIAEQKRRETFRSTVYNDVNAPAIGYGIRLTSPAQVAYYKAHPITEQQAEQMMIQYFNNLQKTVTKSLPNLNHNQLDAVLSISYNMGWHRFTKTELYQYVKRGVVGPVVIEKWQNTAAQYANNAISRKFEARLYHAHVDAHSKMLCEFHVWKIENGSQFPNVIP